MRKSFLIIFLLISAAITEAQTKNTPGFESIFGCQCCTDTFSFAALKEWTFIFKDEKKVIVAYKHNKKKWSTAFSELYKKDGASFFCIDLFERNHKVVLKIYANSNDKSVYLNPRTGHLKN